MTEGTATTETGTGPINPRPDCPLCPRLAQFRQEMKDANPDWFNAPVPGFGAPDARLLIVGLAPGMQGANRTGRPFTGDFAGDLLYATLIKLGLATGTYDRRPDDGLELRGTLITNAVRCLPPQNKPVGAEINTCRPFLDAQIRALPLKVILCLGKIAHDSTVKTLGLKISGYKFGHENTHDIGGGRVMIDSYHCSRYNTNTRRLTTEMFESVVTKARDAAAL